MCEPESVLVKNELWNKIQSRRKAKGLDELKVKEDGVRRKERKVT